MSNTNATGCPACAVDSGTAVKRGSNGTLSHPVSPSCSPQSLGGDGYPGGECLRNAALSNAPGSVHESTLSVVGGPALAQDVGLRRNALDRAPLAHVGPPRQGGSCPGHARSASWTGSGGTPHNVRLRPATASAWGTSAAIKVSP